MAMLQFRLLVRLSSSKTTHTIVAAPDAFAETVGSQQFFRTKAGLDPKAIFDRILQVRSSLPRP